MDGSIRHFAAALTELEAAAREEMAVELEALRMLLRLILTNVRYEQDEHGAWHSFYADKPLAAVATERARALTATDGASDGADDTCPHCHVIHPTMPDCPDGGRYNCEGCSAEGVERNRGDGHTIEGEQPDNCGPLVWVGASERADDD